MPLRDSILWIFCFIFILPISAFWLFNPFIFNIFNNIESTLPLCYLFLYVLSFFSQILATCYTSDTLMHMGFSINRGNLSRSFNGLKTTTWLKTNKQTKGNTVHLYVFRNLQLIYYTKEIIPSKVKCHALKPQIFTSLRFFKVNFSEQKKYIYIANLQNLHPNLQIFFSP